MSGKDLKMIKLHEKGIFLVNGKPSQTADLTPEIAKKNTITYSILQSHNRSTDASKLRISFDACGNLAGQRCGFGGKRVVAH